MRITIEVGTPEQKKLIENEVRLVFNAASNSNQNFSINEIIVPVDFDSTVNTLQGTTSYQSVRNLDEHDIVVNAKVIHNPNGSYLVISPHIFSKWNDAQTRCFIYMHELVHVVRKQEYMFSGAFSIYEHNLETFIEEYIADRIAYGFVDQAFQTKSDNGKLNCQGNPHNLLSFSQIHHIRPP